MRNLIVFMFLAFLSNLVIGQTRAEKKEIQFAKVKEIIASGNFAFVANRAIGRGGMSVDLDANPNYLKVMGDSTAAIMPFFGERFNAGSLNEPGAIQFETEINNKVVEHNDKKGRTTFKFSARNEYDRFGVILEVSRSGWANLLIRSIDRSTINYYGQIVSLEAAVLSP